MSVYGNFLTESQIDELSYFLKDNSIADYSNLSISECGALIMPELAFAECSMNYLFESYLEENDIALNEKIDMKAVGSKVKEGVKAFFKKLKEMIEKVIEKIKEIGKKIAFVAKDFKTSFQLSFVFSEFKKLNSKIKDTDKNNEFNDKMNYYNTKMNIGYIPYFNNYSSNIKIEDWLNKYSKNMKGSTFTFGKKNPTEENINEDEIKQDIIKATDIIDIFHDCYEIRKALNNGDLEKSNEMIRDYKKYFFSDEEEEYYIYDSKIIKFATAAENAVHVGVKFIKSYIFQLEKYKSWVDKNLEIAERFDNGSNSLDDTIQNFSSSFSSSNLKIGSIVIKSSITLLSSTSWFLMSWANDAFNEVKRINIHVAKVNKEMKEYLKTQK